MKNQAHILRSQKFSDISFLRSLFLLTLLQFKLQATILMILVSKIHCSKLLESSQMWNPWGAFALIMLKNNYNIKNNVLEISALSTIYIRIISILTIFYTILILYVNLWTLGVQVKVMLRD